MSVENLQKKLAEFPRLPECGISIVIPVRDETENVEKSLQAFVRQINFNGKSLNFNEFEIIILANNCKDNSFEIIENFRRANSFLNIHLAEIVLPAINANIGFVRRLLMNAAFERLRRNDFGGVIMTTDGDTIVADDWIAANLNEIKNGADAVGGRIIILDAELEKMDAIIRETHLLDEEYRLLTAEIEALIDDLPFDNAPRHHQHFNGSFAVTTEIYEKAGGVPDVKFLEDVAFFDCLQRIDARVRHSLLVKVFTSARRIGRSEVGLSFQLNQWKNLSEAGEDFLVESAASIVERLTARTNLRKIRRKFSSGEITDLQTVKQISAQLFIAPESFLNELEKGRTFGLFYENLMREQDMRGEWARKFPPTALDKALNDLRNEVEKRRIQSFSQTSIR